MPPVAYMLSRSFRAPGPPTDQAQYANSPLSRSARGGRMMPFMPDRNNPLQAQLTRLGSQHTPHGQAHGQGQGDVTSPMDDLFPGARSKEQREKTLFGPNVGSVGGVEERAKWGVGAEVKEELPTEVLQKWVENSSESSTPTTTIQALTNLKRPSIKLSPLTPPSDSDPAATAAPDPLAPHVLEFTYDADCPLVSISVRVLPPTNNGLADAAPAQLKPDGDEVFLTIAKGGFGQQLTAESNAVIELGRYEALPAVPASPRLPSPTQSHPNSPPGSSPAASNPQLQLASRVPADLPSPPAPALVAPPGAGRRRFSSFLPMSNRHRQSTSNVLAPGQTQANMRARARGPALPVVDSTAQPQRQEPMISPALAAQMGFQVVDRQEQEREKQRELDRLEEERSGVRIGVWVEALDANGKRLPTRNLQATFLHVHRVGPKPGAQPDTAAAPAGDLESGTAPSRLALTGDGEMVDTRPWLVRVVHREAIIGKHTFTLHEIYGLASGGAEPHVSPPPQPHTYPPTAAAAAAAAAAPLDTSGSAPECILCLSSPRSVVLMPCRHLVACRDCALNMLEFGAGGTIHQPGEDADAGGAGGGLGAGGAGEGSNPIGQQAPMGMPALVDLGRTERRRKRKVKGWFCPICRQPYTSMLRISSAAPQGELVAEVEMKHAHEHSDAEDAEHELDPGADVPPAQRASTSTVPVGWKVHEDRAGSPASASASGASGAGEAEVAPAPANTAVPVHATPVGEDGVAPALTTAELGAPAPVPAPASAPATGTASEADEPERS